MSQHLASTTATAATCPRCQQPILVALDEGLGVRADLQPVDRAGEIAALAAGRRTYTRTFSGQLVERTAERIRSGRPRGTVHPEHTCPSQPRQATLWSRS